MSQPMTTEIEALIQRWREKAAATDAFHATMGTGWHVCADDLEAALRTQPDEVARLRKHADIETERAEHYRDQWQEAEAEVARLTALVGTPAQLTFERFGEINRQRCESSDGFKHQLASWSTSDWFTAVMGELGEAANVAKKLNRYRDGVPGNKESADALREKLRRELGDTFVYLDLLCQSLGFNIGAAATDVFNAKSDEIGCSIRMSVGTPAPSGWEPIATAPKDGTPVLVAGAGGVDMCSWQDEAPEQRECGVIVDAGYPEGWWGSAYYAGGEAQPTHWMPLPAPPEGRTR